MTGRLREQDGIALIAALIVTSVVVMLTLVALPMAQHMRDSSRVDRKRVYSYHNAEAGLDQAVQKLQTIGFANLPCEMRDPPGETDPRKLKFKVTFRYFTLQNAALPCPLAEPPRKVILTSDGDTTDDIYKGRRIEISANLVPAGEGSGFSEAIFSQGSLPFDNSLEVTGNAGSDANVYTNGSYDCDNSAHSFGYVHAQGTIALSNSCNVVVDAWAYGSLSISNSSNVGRDAISSTSSVSLTNSAVVGRNAIAGTTVSQSVNSFVRGSPVENNLQPAPPHKDFPVLPYDQAAWEAAGYAIKAYPAGVAGCTQATADFKKVPADWEAWWPTGPGGPRQVVVPLTGCMLQFENNTDVKMFNNLAIISSGGVAMANSTTFLSSTSTVTRKLHIIVPYPAVCTGATPPDIKLRNSTNFVAPVLTFLYTPCTLEAGNSAQMLGQMYGGVVRIRNSVNLAFRPIGMIPGSTIVAGQGSTTSINYKREIVR